MRKEWCKIQSIIAFVNISSCPIMVCHLSKVKLLVKIVEHFVYRISINWKNNFASSGLISLNPTTSITSNLYLKNNFIFLSNVPSWLAVLNEWIGSEPEVENSIIFASSVHPPHSWEWTKSRKSNDFRFVCPPPHSWVGLKQVIKTQIETTQPLRF